MDIENLLTELSTRLKQLKYRKQNLTWRKKDNAITIMLNIQKSSFSKEDFYVNLGIYIHGLGDITNPKIYDCQVQQRVDFVHNVDKLVNILMLWEDWYGSIEKLKNKARSNKMPAMTSIDAISFLTRIN